MLFALDARQQRFQMTVEDCSEWLPQRSLSSDHESVPYVGSLRNLNQLAAPHAPRWLLVSDDTPSAPLAAAALARGPAQGQGAGLIDLLEEPLVAATISVFMWSTVRPCRVDDGVQNAPGSCSSPLSVTGTTE